MENFRLENEIIKNKQRKSFYIGIVFALIPVVLIVSIVLLSINTNKNNVTKLNIAKSEKLKLDSINNDLKKVTFEEFTGNSGDSIIDDSLFYQMLLANNKIKKLSNIKPGHFREDIIIRYYPKKIDGNVVYNLKKLGYYIHERPVPVSYEEYKSNIIYYGSLVDSTDVILISLSLVKSGLPLKKIVPFPAPDWRTKAIQIETSKKLLSLKNLTVDEIIHYKRL